MENSEHYKNYAFEQLVEDKDFRNWVFYPSPEQEMFWNDFVKTYPNQKVVVETAKSFLLELKDHFEEEDLGPAHILARLSDTLHRSRQLPSIPSEEASRVKRLWIYHPIAIAAAIALLIGFIGAFLFLRGNDIRTYATNYGEWQTVNLPDGSVVELNANSELTLADSWTEGNTRTVWLKGEAFFQVEKKPATGAKFQVITDDLSIEVLGTAFNVHSRGEQTEVLLEEGKINLDLGKDIVELDPGDFLIYSSKSQKLIQQSNGTTPTHSSWKEGVLTLVDAPVPMIMKKIEEIYGVKILIQKEEIETEVRTIGVPMQKLEVVIPILERSLDVKIIQRNNLLVLQ